MAATAPAGRGFTSSKESAGSFLSRGAFSSKDSIGSRTRGGARAGFSSKESAGSFRDRAVTSSKETAGSGRRQRAGFSSKESAASAVSARSGRSARSSSRDGGPSEDSSVGRRSAGTGARSKERSVRSFRGGAKGGTGSASGFRRGTSRSGRSRSSISSGSGRGGHESDSEDSEDLDDVDAIAEEKRPAVPLYLKVLRNEVVVVGRNDKKDELAETTMSAGALRRVSLFKRAGSALTDALADQDNVAVHEVALCTRAWAVVQACATLLWVLAMSGLLGVYLLRMREVDVTTHRLVADTALRALEVNVSGLLAPATEMVQDLALATHAGITDSMDPFDTLKVLAMPHMIGAPSIRYAQALGLVPGKLMRVLPNTLHDETVRPPREPLVYSEPSGPCTTGKDPISCFELATEGVEFDKSRFDAAGVAWLGPTLLSIGLQGEVLDHEASILAYHLVAKVERPEGSLLPAIYFDIAVELAPMFAASDRFAPPGGQAVVGTTKGDVLGSSSASVLPAAYPDGDGKIRGPKVGDIPESWAVVLSQEVFAEGMPTAIRQGTDLVVVRPLRVGAGESRGAGAASQRTLRAAVMVPTEGAVSPQLVLIQYMAFGVLVFPLLLGLLLGLVSLTIRVVRCACGLYHARIGADLVTARTNSKSSVRSSSRESRASGPPPGSRQVTNSKEVHHGPAGSRRSTRSGE